jgi:lysophospholipase L1-like esterase
MAAVRPGLDDRSERLIWVAMGDSITFGQHLDPELRWTTLVERRLADCFNGIVEVHNRGVSGETTRMGLERFPKDVQEFEPDLVTLQFGLNDCNCWKTDRGLPRVSERSFQANLIEMIARVRRFGARRIILSTSHPTVRFAPMASGEEYESANARYSELVREVAEEERVDLCDIRRAFERFSTEELRALLIPYPDQLHLGPAGNAVYADAIWPFIEQAATDLLEEGFRVMGGGSP